MKISRNKKVEEMKMNRKQAKEYLKRKNEEITEEKIQEVEQKGKIYGDPIVELE